MSPFHYHNNHLTCEAVPLADIVATVGTPTYVYSQAALQQRALAYRQAVPDALICYAVKANGNPTLLHHLGQLGLGADITSGGECFLARHAHIPAHKTIYSGVGKTAVEIEMALQPPGVLALHLESAAELDAIAHIATKLGRVAPIGVRVNPNIYADTHPYISTGQQSHKFGVPPPLAMHLLTQAAAHPWLNPVGLACHLGSQIQTVAPFVQAAHFLVEMAQQLNETGVHLRYLDVGGGLGIDYTDKADNAIDHIQAWATAVAHPIQQAGYQVVMEPGRSIVGPIGALLTKVIYTKEQGEKNFLITDAGMNDLLRPTLYQAHHPIWPLQAPAAGHPTQLVDIVGPICETGDWLAKERPLPLQTAGDHLAILQAGAYGFAMSSNYNGRLRPAELLVTGNTFHVIRPRQTYQHLLIN